MTSPTLVFLPGVLSDEIVWQPVVEAMKSDVPAVCIGQMTDNSLTKMAQRQLAAVSGDLIIVGHSMGGRVAIEMARLAPKRITGLVLADTGMHPKSDGEDAKRQRMIDLAYDQGLAALADVWLPPMVDAMRYQDTRLMSALTQMVLRASALSHDNQMQALLGRMDAQPVLEKLTVPVLYVVGETDQWSSVAQHKDMARVTSVADLSVIPQAGHFAPFERPQIMAQKIDLWLAKYFDMNG